MKNSNPYRYWAFISYSSKDRKTGTWLRKCLENFTIPEDLRGIRFPDGGELGKHLRPIFRDRDELPGSDNLGAKITEALTDSRYLIVLCSPRSAQSQWVNKEIVDFRKMGKGENILALILDGEPNSGDPETECFPPALRYPAEPIAGDLRKEGDGKTRGFLKILAGISQLDFDQIYRRHERDAHRARVRWAGVATGLIVSFALLTVFAFSQKRIAEERERQARRVEGQFYLELARQKVDDRNLQTSPGIQILASQSIAFQGNRPEANEFPNPMAFQQWRSKYPPLLDPSLDDRNYREALDLVNGQPGLMMPLLYGSSPACRHHSSGMFSGMLGGVRKVVWNPQGDRLASVGLFGEVQIWNGKTGEASLRWKAHNSEFHTIIWSPNGNRIATADQDEFCIWDVATGQQVARNDVSVRSMLWHPDGVRLLYGTREGSIRIWDCFTNSETGVLTGHKGDVSVLVLSPDGGTLASVCPDDSVRIWDVATLQPLASPDDNPPDYEAGDLIPFFSSLAWSPDGNLLALSKTSGEIYLWDGISISTLREGNWSGEVTQLSWMNDSSGFFYKIFRQGIESLNIADKNSKVSLPHIDGTILNSMSPDRSRIAGSTFHGDIRVWNAYTGELTNQFEGNSDGVHCLDWNPDGKQLAGACSDGIVRLWDIVDGKQPFRPEGHTSPVNAVAWNPDGSKYASISFEGPIRIWDASNGRLLVTLKGATGAITDLDWSPDGNQLVATSSQTALQIWDATTGASIVTRPVPKLETGTNSVDWSPDRSRIATTSTYHIQIWSDTGEPLTRLGEGKPGEESIFSDVEWSPDGTRLAARSEAGIMLWETGGQTPLSIGNVAIEKQSQSSPNPFFPKVLTLAWSPDGEILATTGPDEFLSFRDGNNGEELDYVYVGRLTAIDWSRNGGRLAVGTGESIQLWDLYPVNDRWQNGPLPVAKLVGHSIGIKSLAFSPEGDRLASGGVDGLVRLWDVADTPVLEIGIESADTLYTGISWSPDGKRLATTTESIDKPGTAQLWDIESGTVLTTFTGPANSIKDSDWSPDGSRLATASSLNSIDQGYNGVVQVWDVESGKLSATLEGHRGGVNCVDWRPDGKQIASAGEDKTIRLWDSDTWAQTILGAHDDLEITSLQWRPDGSSLASSSFTSIHIWDVAAKTNSLLLGEWVSDFPKPISWSPDGQQLAAGNVKNGVRVWQVDGPEILASLDTGRVKDAPWSPDGKYIACVLHRIHGGAIQIRDAGSRDVVATLRTTVKIIKAAWSPDSSRIAGVSQNGSIRIWDLAMAQSHQSEKPDLNVYYRNQWAKLDLSNRDLEWQTFADHLTEPKVFNMVNVRRDSVTSVLREALAGSPVKVNEKLLDYYLSRHQWNTAFLYWAKLREGRKASRAVDLITPFYQLAASPDRGGYPPDWFGDHLEIFFDSYPERFGEVLARQPPLELRTLPGALAQRNLPKSSPLIKIALKALQVYEQRLGQDDDIASLRRALTNPPPAKQPPPLEGFIIVINHAIPDSSTESGFTETGFISANLKEITKVEFGTADILRPGMLIKTSDPSRWAMENNGTRTPLDLLEFENAAIVLKAADGIEQFRIDLEAGFIFNRNDVDRPEWARILRITKAHMN